MVPKHHFCNKLKCIILNNCFLHKIAILILDFGVHNVGPFTQVFNLVCIWLAEYQTHCACPVTQDVDKVSISGSPDMTQHCGQTSSLKVHQILGLKTLGQIFFSDFCVMSGDYGMETINILGHCTYAVS